jgi:hypothetical protein
LKNVGNKIRFWKDEWKSRRNGNPDLPIGEPIPLGYIALLRSAKDLIPVNAYDRYVNQIPAAFQEYILGETKTNTKINDDPNCIGQLKYYRFLIDIAMQAKKPMFGLKVADGADGSQIEAVKDVYRDFKNLCLSIIKRTTI